MKDGLATVKGLRVLIVDDDESYCRILRELLAGLGCLTDYAVSLAEARRVLQRREHDVLLLDHRFPEGDGLDLMSVVDEVGESRSKPSVVAVSAHDDPMAEARFFASGGLAWIRKPFRSTQLIERLEEAARRRLPRGRES